MNQEPRERFFRRERPSVPAAREFTRAALADWGVGEDRAHDITLCVSELATNALLHGVPPGRGYLLCLLPGGDSLRVEVHDSGNGVPCVVRPDEGGRGLILVAALADAWGVGERDPGKVVWCEFGRLSPRPRTRMVEGTWATGVSGGTGRNGAEARVLGGGAAAEAVRAAAGEGGGGRVPR